jgi:hypothetical protein
MGDTMTPLQDLKDNIETVLPTLASDIETFDKTHWLDVWSWKIPQKSVTIRYIEDPNGDIYHMYTSQDPDWENADLKLSSIKTVLDRLTVIFEGLT